MVAGVEVSPDHFIGGQRVASARRFPTISPVDQSVLAEVARADADDVDRAVRAAADAFPAWAALGPTGRAPYLHRLADLIDQNVERLALVESADMAMLLRSLRARVIHRGARNFRNYADLCVSYEERDWHSNGTWNRVQRMPAGPAAVITPWNAPFMLSTWKVAPALAAGCPVVLKPAEWSPLSCSLLAELSDEAGFPPGVFNVIQGIGEEAGAALVSHPLIRRVSFTGSPEAARQIGVSAAQNLVPFTGELGGKGPLIVFADADLEAAAAEGRRPVRRCRSGVSGGYPPAGPGEHPRGVPGALPCRSRPAGAGRPGRRRHNHLAADPSRSPGPGRGLRRARQGRRPPPAARRASPRVGPLFFEPTLFEPLSNEAEIVQREVFGPVLTFQTFADEDEAVALANSTQYGLSGDRLHVLDGPRRSSRAGRSGGRRLGQHVPGA